MSGSVWNVDPGELQAADDMARAGQEQADQQHETNLKLTDALGKKHRVIKEQQAIDNPDDDMLLAAGTIYQMRQGKEYTGEPSGLIQYGIEEMGRFNHSIFQADNNFLQKLSYKYNPLDMTTTEAMTTQDEIGMYGYMELMESDQTTPDQKLAFLHLSNAYTAMDMDNLNEAARMGQAMVSDPSSLGGIAALASQGLKYLGKKGLKSQMRNRIEASLALSLEGAAFGDAYSRIHQQAIINASDNPYFSQQTEQDNTLNALSSGIGGTLGAVLPNAPAIAKGAWDGLGAITDKMYKPGQLNSGFGPTDGPLPMDEASRTSRSEVTGHTKDAYHGSTHDIESYGGATLNPEGHFGAAHYFTSSPDDANRHYAGLGPDLTQRIESRVDQLSGEVDGYEADDLMGVYPDMTKREAASIANGNPELFDRVMHRIAKKELAGDSDGVVYPTRLRTDNSFDISSEGDTFMRYESREMDPSDYMDEAKEHVYKEDYDTDADYIEALTEQSKELAQEDAWNFEPEGELVDFIDSLQRQAYNYEVDSLDEVVDSIREAAMDGGINAKELDDLIRSSNLMAYNNEGQIVTNEIYRQAIEDSGFDSIVHNADIFKGMDTESGTRHTIVFNPKNIRSKFAKFNPKNKGSASLTASVVGGGIALKSADKNSEDGKMPKASQKRSKSKKTLSGKGGAI